MMIINLQVAVDLIDLKFSPLNATSGSFGAVSALKENGKVVNHHVLGGAVKNLFFWPESTPPPPVFPHKIICQ